MEIGEQGIDELELEARTDEQPRLTRPRATLAHSQRSRFQSPDHRRSDRDHPAAVRSRALHCLARLGAHGDSLGVHCVRLQIVSANRLKSPRPDMQRNKRAAHTPRCDFIGQHAIEMEAGRRRCNRTVVAGEDALVPLAIVRIRRAMDIGGQRHLAPGLEEFQGRSGRFDDPQVIPAFDDAHRAARGGNLQSWADGLAGADLSERLRPLQRPLQEDLDASAGGLGAYEAGGNDPGVIENEEIAGAKQCRQLLHVPVAHLSGRAVEHEEAAPRALGERRLRNQLFGESVGKVVASHTRMVTRSVTVARPSNSWSRPAAPGIVCRPAPPVMATSFRD